MQHEKCMNPSKYFPLHVVDGRQASPLYQEYSGVTSVHINFTTSSLYNSFAASPNQNQLFKSLDTFMVLL